MLGRLEQTIAAQLTKIRAKTANTVTNIADLEDKQNDFS